MTISNYFYHFIDSKGDEQEQKDSKNDTNETEEDNVSDEPIHLAHFEPKFRYLEPLADPRAADLFWCRLD